MTTLTSPGFVVLIRRWRGYIQLEVSAVLVLCFFVLRPLFSVNTSRKTSRLTPAWCLCCKPKTPLPQNAPQPRNRRGRASCGPCCKSCSRPLSCPRRMDVFHRLHLVAFLPVMTVGFQVFPGRAPPTSGTIRNHQKPRGKPSGEREKPSQADSYCEPFLLTPAPSPRWTLRPLPKVRRRVFRGPVSALGSGQI